MRGAWGFHFFWTQACSAALGADELAKGGKSAFLSIRAKAATAKSLKGVGFIVRALRNTLASGGSDVRVHRLPCKRSHQTGTPAPSSALPWARARARPLDFRDQGGDQWRGHGVWLERLQPAAQQGGGRGAAAAGAAQPLWPLPQPQPGRGRGRRWRAAQPAGRCGGRGLRGAAAPAARRAGRAAHRPRPAHTGPPDRDRGAGQYHAGGAAGGRAGPERGGAAGGGAGRSSRRRAAAGGVPCPALRPLSHSTW